jgi:hypothetical protein
MDRGCRWCRKPCHRAGASREHRCGAVAWASSPEFFGSSRARGAPKGCGGGRLPCTTPWPTPPHGARQPPQAEGPSTRLGGASPALAGRWWATQQWQVERAEEFGVPSQAVRPSAPEFETGPPLTVPGGLVLGRPPSAAESVSPEETAGSGEGSDAAVVAEKLVPAEIRPLLEHTGGGARRPLGAQ